MAATIVVPLDRSEVSERALPYAKALARQLNARIHLVSVIEAPPDYAAWVDTHSTREPWQSRVAGVDLYLQGVAGRLEFESITTEILMGLDPAVEIDEAIAAMGDALLVMSGHGRSGLQRLILGSKTARLVQLASYPLIIIPAECEEPPESFSHILLALDGSTFAEHAQEVVLDLLGSNDVSFHLLRVVDPILVDAEIDEAVRKELVNNASRYLEAVAKDLTERGYTVTWEVEESYDIANRIVTVAHHNDCDLIALATHGRTGFSRLFYGSVANGVLRTATRPVLIVHPSEEVIARAPESRSTAKR